MVNNGILAAVAVVGTFVAVGVILDNKRRSDPEYQKKLKQRRREAKEAKQRAEQEEKEAKIARKKAQEEKRKAAKSQVPDKNDKAKVEEYFMAELQRGEEALARGDVEAGAQHFANAIQIHDHPAAILGQLTNMLPEPLMQLVVACLDPDMFRDNYFDTFPSNMTDKVDIKVVDSGDKQRVVVAKKDIAPGETIAEEDAFAAAFHPLAATSELCGNCHKKFTGKPVQCKEKCGWETYCSERCRDTAWDVQHRLFCGKTPKSQAAVQKLLAITKESKDADPLIVGRLLARVFPAETGKKVTSDHAADISHLHYRDPLPEPTAAHKEVVKELCNTMRDKVDIIDEVLQPSSYMALLNKVQQNKIAFESVPGSGDVTGHGIFLLGAFFNHSCDPNMRIQSLGGSRVAYVATREIKAGEEVCRAYVDVSGKDTKERQGQLKEAYGFHCECPQCSGKVVAPASGVTA